MSDDSGSIRLDQFLKRQGLVETGGQAKQLIQSGEVWVNGAPEKHRRHRVRPGDVIQLFDIEVTVDEEDVRPAEDLIGPVDDSLDST